MYARRFAYIVMRRSKSQVTVLRYFNFFFFFPSLVFLIANNIHVNKNKHLVYTTTWSLNAYTNISIVINLSIIYKNYNFIKCLSRKPRYFLGSLGQQTNHSKQFDKWRTFTFNRFFHEPKSQCQLATNLESFAFCVSISSAIKI